MLKYILVLLFVIFLTVLPVSAKTPHGDGEGESKGNEVTVKDDKEIAEMIDMLAVLDMLEQLDVLKDMEVLAGEKKNEKNN